MPFRNALSHLGRLARSLHQMPAQIDALQQAVGRIEARQTANENRANLAANEFKVFSQWGEDGIIQYLLRNMPDVPHRFVEFGVGDYSESNTRFLLRHANWNGLLIDGLEKNCKFIQASNEYWQHDLSVECAFITRDNINHLISKNGFSGDIGILSVDIDGNDYWIWEQIDCVNPAIVICEYNSLFGPEAPISVPYRNDFYIFSAHYSGLYWGASISAFDHLARAKGYVLVGSNSAGNNIFFVRKDLAGAFPPLDAQAAHVPSRFRISRNEDGSLSYLNGQQARALIADMPLVDVVKGTSASFASYFLEEKLMRQSKQEEV